jgi:hypothetical protein
MVTPWLKLDEPADCGEKKLDRYRVEQKEKPSDQKQKPIGLQQRTLKQG